MDKVIITVEGKGFFQGFGSNNTPLFTDDRALAARFDAEFVWSDAGCILDEQNIAYDVVEA